MADSSSESKGILFVYDTDGENWINYLKHILTGPEYSIPCTSVLWSNLSEDLTSCHPVHILFLTPEMEPHFCDIEHSLLNYSSETSLLLECNVDSSRFHHVNWAIKQKLEDDIESQRVLLSTIVQLYETAVNDAVYDQIVPNVHIIPSKIFPGQEEVYVIFSKNPNSDIIVKLSGEKLRTRKCSDLIYACDLSKIACGQKIISIYKKDSTYPISTTKIAIITVKALLQNLMDNMESALGVSSDFMESFDETKYQRLTTVFEIGFNFNPFHKASDDTLKQFAGQIHKMYNNSLQDNERDSGFAPEVKDHEVFMPIKELEYSLPELPAKSRTTRRTDSLPETEVILRNESFPEKEVIRRSESLKETEEKIKRKDKILKMFGIKRTSFDKEKKEKFKNRRMSKRMVNASQQYISDMPQLPKKTARRTYP